MLACSCIRYGKHAECLHLRTDCKENKGSVKMYTQSKESAWSACIFAQIECGKRTEFQHAHTESMENVRSVHVCLQVRELT